MIGSIEVKSHGDEIIPEEPVTTRKISSGEIEHMQATSLGDVLNLIPGIEKTSNPGLSSASRVGIRSTTLEGTAGMLESYGTVIMVDGNEMSTGGDVGSDSRTGIDLREIPADNIESVEVISGIPSVEYGNFSGGLIKVKTKSGYIANKLKAKLNPDTKTASYSGGHKFKKSFMDWHFNYGLSERDLREKGDNYYRLYGKLSYNHPFLSDKLNTITNLTYTKIYDDDSPVGAQSRKSIREGFKTSMSFSFDYEQDENTNWTGFLGSNMNRRKDFKEHFVTDAVYIPADTVVKYKGVSLSDTIVAGYMGSYDVLGYQLDFSGNFKYKKKLSLNEQDHTLLAGLNSKYETNIGDGVVLDDFWNYYGYYSEKKSYSYDQYGGISQYSLFFQDQIKGKLLSNKFNLMVGLRFSSFNSADNFFDGRNGRFLLPRFNFQYFFTENLRFRVGAGKSARSVSLGYLYKEPMYYKYVKDSVLVEEKYEQRNPKLQAYTTDKYEASIDWKPIKAIGFSLTGYYTKTDDSPEGRSYPVGYSVNPDTLTEANYSIYKNIGWKDSYGIEFTTRTKRIKNLQFKLNVTYRYTEKGRSGTIYDPSPNLSVGESVWYNTNSQWREKVIIDYQVNYVSQRLGAWVTLDIQQTAMDNKQNTYHSNSYPFELNDVEYTWYQGQTYWYDTELYEYGNKWLFNLRITKSLARKTECSLYINNLFDDRALWINPFTTSNSERNPEIYYGLEVSTQW
jgi:outer membrane receptor for ferrienterochelin and colicin